MKEKLFILTAVLVIAAAVIGWLFRSRTADSASEVSGSVALSAAPTSSAAQSEAPSSSAASVAVSSEAVSKREEDEDDEDDGEENELHVSNGVTIEAFIAEVIDIAEDEPRYPVENGETKYGALFGAPKAQWCTEFIMYCLRTAEDKLDTEFIGEVYPWRDSAWDTGIWFKRHDRYYENGSGYMPSAGDLIIFDTQSQGYPNHTGMVTGVVTENGKTYITTIEGNIPEDDVKQIRSRTLLVTDPIIMGYCSTTVVTPYEGSLTDFS